MPRKDFASHMLEWAREKTVAFTIENNSIYVK